VEGNPRSPKSNELEMRVLKALNFVVNLSLVIRVDDSDKNHSANAVAVASWILIATQQPWEMEARPRLSPQRRNHFIQGWQRATEPLGWHQALPEFHPPPPAINAPAP